MANNTPQVQGQGLLDILNNIGNGIGSAANGIGNGIGSAANSLINFKNGMAAGFDQIGKNNEAQLNQFINDKANNAVNTNQPSPKQTSAQNELTSSIDNNRSPIFKDNLVDYVDARKTFPKPAIQEPIQSQPTKADSYDPLGEEGYIYSNDGKLIYSDDKQKELDAMSYENNPLKKEEERKASIGYTPTSEKTDELGIDDLYDQAMTKAGITGDGYKDFNTARDWADFAMSEYDQKIGSKWAQAIMSEDRLKQDYYYSHEKYFNSNGVKSWKDLKNSDVEALYKYQKENNEWTDDYTGMSNAQIDSFNNMFNYLMTNPDAAKDAGYTTEDIQAMAESMAPVLESIGLSDQFTAPNVYTTEGKKDRINMHNRANQRISNSRKLGRLIARGADANVDNDYMANITNEDEAVAYIMSLLNNVYGKKNVAFAFDNSGNVDASKIIDSKYNGSTSGGTLGAELTEENLQALINGLAWRDENGNRRTLADSDTIKLYRV